MKTKQEIEAALSTVFDDAWSDYKSEFTWDGSDVKFTATAMYEYYDVTIANLATISEICGTDSISVEKDEDYDPGCSSCNWGSRYSTIFVIKNVQCAS